MLELSNEAMSQYWAAVSSAASGVIAAMDASEDWLPARENVDDHQLSEFFAALPGRFQRLSQPQQQTEFIAELVVILAYLNSSRALYLTHWLDQALSQVGCDFLRTLNSLHEKAGPGQIDRVGLGLLRARIRFLRKTVVLQAVFAPERLAMLSAALMTLEEGRL